MSTCNANTSAGKRHYEGDTERGMDFQWISGKAAEKKIDFVSRQGKSTGKKGNTSSRTKEGTFRL